MSLMLVQRNSHNYINWISKLGSWLVHELPLHVAYWKHTVLDSFMYISLFFTLSVGLVKRDLQQTPSLQGPRELPPDPDSSLPQICGHPGLGVWGHQSPHPMGGAPEPSQGSHRSADRSGVPVEPASAVGQVPCALVKPSGKTAGDRD